MNRAALTLATWFGCGYFPWGPGTAGAAAAVLIAAVIHFSAGAGRITLLILIGALFAPAVWAATRTARLVKATDPGIVVADEVLGQWVTLLGAAALNWKTFLAGFLLFRIFDIWKPWPVYQFEKLPEGAGIICDDIAAGIYGALILYIGGRLRLY
ncbi:MAG TPA: phosphatidylglycerophosphatase A [Bryobacteraceae bacterium]|nr:phosphatidylglycerophosphatase A [Bryobacteraceae bacterium]